MFVINRAMQVCSTWHKTNWLAVLHTWGETLNTALDTIVDGVNGASGTVAPDPSTLKINGTDVTATANELNVMDGDTVATSTTVTGSDAIVYNDNGVMKQVTLNDIKRFHTIAGRQCRQWHNYGYGGGALTGGSFTTNQATRQYNDYCKPPRHKQSKTA